MRTTFAALLAGVVALLLIGVAPAQGALGDVETPTVTGPVPVTADSTPWAATEEPLGAYGYVEQEFEYAGDAFSYDTASGTFENIDATKITTGGPVRRRQVPLPDADDRPPSRRSRRLQRDRRRRVAERDRAVRPRGELVRRPRLPAPQRLRLRRDLLAARRRQLPPQLECRPLRGPRRQRPRRGRRRDDHRRRPLLRHLRGRDQGAARRRQRRRPARPARHPRDRDRDRRVAVRRPAQHLLQQGPADPRDRRRVPAHRRLRDDPRRSPGADDPGPQRDREPDPAHGARRRQLPPVGGGRRLAPAADGVRHLPGPDRARSRPHPRGLVRALSALPGPVAVRRQLGIRAPRQVGERRLRAADRAARRVRPERRPGGDRPARPRRARARPGRHPAAGDDGAGETQHRASTRPAPAAASSRPSAPCSARPRTCPTRCC